jgi:hypothetical protein
MAWSVESVEGRLNAIATLEGAELSLTRFLELRNLRPTRVEKVGKLFFFFFF